MRSKLFVPGARPDFFEKALRSDADALSFDLEDSVPAGGKAEARGRIAELFASDRVRGCGKTIIVRVNAPGSPDFEADLEALAGTHLHFVNLPKIEEPGAVAAASDRVGRACPKARLLLNIETPAGLARAADIAASDSRVAGLQIGFADLFEPLHIARNQPLHVHMVQWQVRMAAAQANLFVYDGAWPMIDDDDGFRREAEMARGMGFLGKSCIHPRQVAIANAIFERGRDVAEARRLVDQADAAASAGKGAFRLDGTMIDAPAIARARSVLDSKGGGR